VPIAEDALETLRQKWRGEQEHITIAEERLAELEREINRLDPENCDELWRYKRLIAGCLSDSYSGIERTLREVVKQLDEEDIESEKQWHKHLAEKVAEHTEVRDPVLSEEGKKAVRRMIEFRHMDRFNYPEEIQWEELMVALDTFSELFPPLLEEVTDYLDNARDHLKVDVIPIEQIEGRDGLDIEP
jgi:hypothetical protein